MKHLMKLHGIVGIASALVTTTVLAQNVISIDENGNGFFNGAAIPGVLSPVDPSGGTAGPVLIYTLPAAGGALTIGDAVLLEPPVGQTNISDVVRFWEQNQIIFYSDRETTAPDNDPADRAGLPSSLLANNVVMAETGVEGNNGASYLALPGQPGWDGNPLGTQYRIISDVPEPGSALLSILGGGLFLLLRCRRQAGRI